MIEALASSKAESIWLTISKGSSSLTDTMEARGYRMTYFKAERKKKVNKEFCI
jgi:hypothetical protein